MPRVEKEQQPVIIHENGVYTAEQVRRLLGLADGTIRREVRAGRLRVAERCNRYYFTGQWLLEWITAGEKPSTRKMAGAVEEATIRPVYPVTEDA